ncbi:MAG: hypothetical protein NC191_01915 [Muribaculaceae bacterium]|nr:hypothetical protein [Muribaculaceae bacterium]
MDLSIKDNFASKAIDRINDYANNFKLKQQRHNNKIELGNLLNGQIPYSGVQTAAANLDK